MLGILEWKGAGGGGGGGNRAKSITFKRCLNIYLTPVAAERMREREKHEFLSGRTTEKRKE